MKTRIIYILSALVVGLAGFLLYESFSSEMSEVEVKAQFSDLKAEYQQMQGDLETAIGEIEVKNQEIIAQKRELDALVSKGKITEEELQKAKSIMKNLTDVVLKSYQTRLASLDNKHHILLQEKEKLTQEVLQNKEKLAQLDEKYTKEKRLSERKDKIISTKDTVLKRRDEQISVASRLILSNFILNGFKVRSSGKEIQTDKASRIDRIKVSFDLIPNPLADSGKKLIYIIIKKPSGEIVSFENKPTGFFMLQDRKMLYSDELAFDYLSGEEKTLEFAWDNENFERGNYTMEIYEKTSVGIVLIGKTTKSLR